MRKLLCACGLHRWGAVPGVGVRHCSPCGRVQALVLVDLGRAKVWLDGALDRAVDLLVGPGDWAVVADEDFGLPDIYALPISRLTATDGVYAKGLTREGAQRLARREQARAMARLERKRRRLSGGEVACTALAVCGFAGALVIAMTGAFA